MEKKGVFLKLAVVFFVLAIISIIVLFNQILNDLSNIIWLIIGICGFLLFLPLFGYMFYKWYDIYKEDRYKEESTKQKEKRKREYDELNNKVKRLKEKKEHYFDDILNGNSTVFHSILNEKIPVEKWQLIENSDDTLKAFRRKQKVFEIIKLCTYVKLDGDSIEDLKRSIVDECMNKNLMFENETFKDIYKLIEHQLNILSFNIASYIINDIIPVLKQKYPKEPIDCFLRTVYRHYNFEALSNFKNELLWFYAKKYCPDYIQLCDSLKQAEMNLRYFLE